MTRRGLVLGAGGVLGAAWTVGALTALEAVVGCDAREFDEFVGTSAGSAAGHLRPARGSERWRCVVLDERRPHARSRRGRGLCAGSGRDLRPRRTGADQNSLHTSHVSLSDPHPLQLGTHPPAHDPITAYVSGSSDEPSPRATTPPEDR